ncbi:SAM-dependent methyltransferase [Nocardia panacis]|uniref:S-adenosyl-L-methionine-dependent methyltransferase n=1 Tax=Nocardia panacis TaxID=2340916 RepID=A0A3A4K1P4_9NOCA|nr:SAM-dependent methyltransferase [Nocardia panacis]RJO73670.1 SAM-dependent methyltransferase [Nocardia panacis]
MRTEGDTWDIVSSVGVTALGVAAARALATTRPDALVHDEYAARFVEAAGHEGMRKFVRDQLDDTGVPVALMGFRTKFYDDHFSAAAAAGVRQAVILAAGLDARAYRLDWPAGMVVFELDQPRVLEFKARVLTESQPAARRVEVPIDLRADWPAALVAAGFDAAAPTVWSAEGLLPYLPGPAQDALFERIDRLSAPGSSLATEMLTDPSAMADIGKFQALCPAFTGIDLRQLVYVDERADPDAWFTAHGWSVEMTTTPQLAERYHRPMPEIPPEYAPMFDSSVFLSAIRH